MVAQIALSMMGKICESVDPLIGIMLTPWGAFAQGTAQPHYGCASGILRCRLLAAERRETRFGVSHTVLLCETDGILR
jgi:hypothetical protein